MSYDGYGIDDICFIDCVFKVNKTIKSLPYYHGARWIAWLRFACREEHLNAEEIISSIFPLRCGKTPLQDEEFVCLRILTEHDKQIFLPQIVHSMMTIQNRGEFCAEKLSFIAFIDSARRTFLSEYDLKEKRLLPIGTNLFQDEIRTIIDRKTIQLEFLSPMRLTLPAGEKHLKDPEKKRYCTADWFRQNPVALAHMLSHVRHVLLPPEYKLPENDVSILESDLAWHDLRYNEKRSMALGGVTGTMRISVQSEEAAFLLTLGQYLGAGRNGRFGLGFWRIAELDDIRKIPLR